MEAVKKKINELLKANAIPFKNLSSGKIHIIDKVLIRIKDFKESLFDYTLKDFMNECLTIFYELKVVKVEIRDRWVVFGIKGWPDIIGYSDQGLFWGIECKSKNDKLSPKQIETLNDMASKNCLAILYTESTRIEKQLNDKVKVCRTTEEVLHYMREYNVLKQGSLF